MTRLSQQNAWKQNLWDLSAWSCNEDLKPEAPLMYWLALPSTCRARWPSLLARNLWTAQSARLRRKKQISSFFLSVSVWASWTLQGRERYSKQQTANSLTSSYLRIHGPCSFLLTVYFAWCGHGHLISCVPIVISLAAPHMSATLS